MHWIVLASYMYFSKNARRILLDKGCDRQTCQATLAASLRESFISPVSRE
jgi:hypothetical protein